MRIQMKITHKNDFEAINYYQKFNKYINKENKVPLNIRKIQKHISCQFPILSDLFQKTNIKTSRGSSNGASIPITQKIFSYLTHGDTNYYDLPDIK